MGFDLQTLRFVLDSKRRGVDFSSTAMLGRQTLAVPADDLRAEIDRYGLERLRPTVADIYAAFPYSDGLLRALGAEQLDAIDVSGYEGASVVLDMNRPAPESLHARFTAIIDGGTLEPSGRRRPRNVAARRVGGHFVS
jgi:hypothetical protein